MAPPNDNGPKIAPQNDIYTLMLIMAAGMLLYAIIVLVVRSFELFESLLPPGGM